MMIKNQVAETNEVIRGHLPVGSKNHKIHSINST